MFNQLKEALEKGEVVILMKGENGEIMFGFSQPSFNTENTIKMAKSGMLKADAVTVKPC
jgi:glutaredoxin-related protein